MDNMDNTNIMVSISLVLSVLSNIIHVINHSRIRSSCCGKSVEASIDISSTENLSP